MKKSELYQLIREEIKKTLEEGYASDVGWAKKIRDKERKAVNKYRKEAHTYFNTYSAALNYVRKEVEKKYDIDEDDWFNQLSVGGKPSMGKTKKGIGIELIDKKTGKAPGKKKLHVQVYGMESGKYELNWYIS